MTLRTALSLAIAAASLSSGDAFVAPSALPATGNDASRAGLSLRMSAPQAGQVSRRAFGGVALAGAASLLVPSNAQAVQSVPVYQLAVDPSELKRGDGKWAEHTGAFDDKEISEGFKETESGLKYKDVVVGKGDAPKVGQVVYADYTGYVLESGVQWGTTYGAAKTRSIRAGAKKGQKFMSGLNEGLLTMKPGGKRILVLPPALAYNFLGIKDEKNPGKGDIIPAFSTLVCYVEVAGLGPEEEVPTAPAQ
mmetsp:Transcript_6016/g.15323  ORF Transcript_6016/g.15323 Transcript_6016/m.15323 type:complete len:250 (-) Transcript_6016:93-842(-)|eukprot:CAMPEP_0206227666 /NCGR_PEP_ID=MMETSP0047_2-20121206/8750_1 /ASSEMBLY_ACC=CAM_ASM_000192 /TAXON_ID=195065 /ORGANISM="Chroomonas mesostigmatica_cf, Strain CCMP1168" /LENGTH=249 /DNA_ID=CAMNT_0053650843 /DNA_START=11 /DNA_END=760 /DNA_ORIENTATION=-